MKKSLLQALLISCLFLAQESFSATVFMDNSFDLTNYSIEIFQNGGATAGNPGSALVVTTTVASGNPSHLSYEYLLNSNFVYSPANDGTIDTIDFSMDRWIDVQGTNLAFWGATILVEQDNRLYRTAVSLSPIENT